MPPHDLTRGLATSLAPYFEERGFSRNREVAFILQLDDSERRYILTDRVTRDLPHARVFVAPAVHVFFPAISRRAAEFAGSKPDSKVPTVGGSIGLYSEKASLVEYEIPDATGIPELRDRLRREIERIAEPFWLKFGTVDQLASATLNGDEWVPKTTAWIFQGVAILERARGREVALGYLRTKEKRLGTAVANAVAEKLLASR